MGKIERPSLESLVMDFAMSLTRRATCKRFQVGCVITSEDMTQIYGFGYNGTAKGLSHDDCKVDQPGGGAAVLRELNALFKGGQTDHRRVALLRPSRVATGPRPIWTPAVRRGRKKTPLNSHQPRN